ncbi:DUF2184 domain-containing protein [Roseomonas mucosa]|uniref:DUF2184 domain-containing protein n=1 Tax=Roseomonas mucosa TaxID=207340 RepID=UPI0022459598|nr:DUF2184 domain-containing protein [Roseomonas mucosa]UZO91759.1 Phage-related protein [Roseomonas mucosa]
MRTIVNDAPSLALSYLRTAQGYIEPQVYQRQYPDLQYPTLVPVDNSAPEWTRTVNFFSIGEDLGQARWFQGEGDDVPFADFKLDKGDSPIFMAAIGYRYNLEELAHAQMYGIQLTPERAAAARHGYETFVEKIAFQGDARLGLTGLLNGASVTVVAAPNGAGGTATWATKTPDEIAKDVNDAIFGVYSSTNGIEAPNTLLLPISRLNYIATKRLSDTTTTTVLEHIQRVNSYTVRTGQPLLIRGVFGMETAGAGGTARMLVYRRDIEVVKMHIPMPHKFLPAESRLLKVEVPGIFRLGGVEWRRPGAARYVDGI